MGGEPPDGSAALQPQYPDGRRVIVGISQVLKVDPSVGGWGLASMSGPWSRDLDTDLDAVRAWGAAAVVTLVESWELDHLQVPGLGQAVHDRGLTWLHLPIRDVSIPDAAFERRWPEAGPALHEFLRGGSHVLVHCRGGLGRAGTIAARLLVEAGVTADEAIAMVRRVRPGAIETLEQEDFVRELRIEAKLGAAR